MATYYVRPGGTGNGTGPAVNQAWGTFQAPFTSGSGVTGGDTVYIAPGHYNEKVTVTITSPTSTVNVIGDVTGSQFSGVTSGFVRLSGFSSTGNAAASLTAPQLSGTSKDFLSFTNIIFEGSSTGAAGNNLVSFTTSKNISFTKCLFINDSFATLNTQGALLRMTAPAASAGNYTLSKCVFMLSGRIPADITGNNVADTTSMKDCIVIGGNAEGFYFASIQATVRNCTFTGNSSANGSLLFASGSASFPSTVQNCLFLNCGTGIAGTTTTVTEDYNRFVSCSANRNGVNTGTNSTSVGASRLDYGYSRIVGLNPIDFFGPQQNSPNQGFGSASGAEAADVMSIAWTGATPDSGYQTFSSVATLSPTYNPTERNASTITIAPASTSQSIELYLGATGLTYATSGLAAYYVRNQSAPVAITLVTQTPTGAWASGGFAEISSSLVPGVYRLDVPNAAFAAGASDVTIVVRGASGTNGAVLTVTLSSGGLTAAQTAAAVWDATVAGYITSTNFGGVMMETNNVVNGIEAEVQDVPSDVWQELRTNHTTAGTFGQYVNAELVTPVTSAALVRMGPFEVRADGLGASDPLDIQKGAQHGIDIQCVDNNGAGIDITSATVTAKVYNSGATLVDTYSCTATYAADGRATFTVDTTVTNTPGTYTATITRSTSANDTQIFGPLRIYVRDI
jgi:hypothetical protein